MRYLSAVTIEHAVIVDEPIACLHNGIYVSGCRESHMFDYDTVSTYSERDTGSRYNVRSRVARDLTPDDGDEVLRHEYVLRGTVRRPHNEDRVALTGCAQSQRGIDRFQCAVARACTDSGRRAEVTIIAVCGVNVEHIALRVWYRYKAASHERGPECNVLWISCGSHGYAPFEPATPCQYVTPALNRMKVLKFAPLVMKSSCESN